MKSTRQGRVVGGNQKKGILNNRKEILMATKKITEVIHDSLRFFCLKFRHNVQYPEPLLEKSSIVKAQVSIQFWIEPAADHKNSILNMLFILDIYMLIINVKYKIRAQRKSYNPLKLKGLIFYVLVFRKSPGNLFLRFKLLFIFQ